MRARPQRVALTGGIATGKSRCLAALAASGVPTIDADQLARDVVGAGTQGIQSVVERFGRSVLTREGGLDRRALGAMVFADPGARRDLERIIHPAVYAAIGQWFSALQAPFGVADIPLLFETGHEGGFDTIVVAACRPDQQLARLVARTGLPVADALARIGAQLPLAEKISRADYVIDTSGTVEQTDANTRAVWAQIQAAAGLRGITGGAPPR